MWQPSLLASSRAALSSGLRSGLRESATQRSHHCVDSFLNWSLSEMGGLAIVWSHLERAPGPPRTCSPLASSVSMSGSARGVILLFDGWAGGTSNTSIVSCSASDLRASRENASGPWGVVARAISQWPRECVCAGWRVGGRGTPSALSPLSQRGRLDSIAGSTMMMRDESLDSRRSLVSSIVALNECSSRCSSKRCADAGGSTDSGWCGGTHGGRSDCVSIGCWSSKSIPW